LQTPDTISPEVAETGTQPEPPTDLVPAANGRPLRMEPDLDFIHRLELRNKTFRNCFQCGTCSATCDLSPDTDPFPRKEMAWALWGLRERLATDPDVWLCYQCTDCSVRCPRDAKPGDVMAAVRRESIIRYSVPGFMAKILGKSAYIPLLLGFPAVLLGVLLFLRDPIESVLGIGPGTGQEITYAYSHLFPHWLLNSFFLFFALVTFLLTMAGVYRFWHGMKAFAGAEGRGDPVKSVGASFRAALAEVFTHNNFRRCTSARPRFLSHSLVFFGFAALSVVTLWVITSSFNPLIKSNFVYPFSFWSPWKILANLGGAALFAGCALFVWDRLKEGKPMGGGTYFDWVFIWALFFVVASGFATELLHYLRLEPHRHVVYFIHLVLVFVFLINLPFSKFAHVFYRFAALVYAEHTGRNRELKSSADKVEGAGEAK
jgi:quinone-modifying oxidoreductase subunit QmoC